jgi:bacillithiol biosynthesis cysteine-adding enzyme BshC
MNNTKIAFDHTQQFPQIFIDYACCKPEIASFCGLFPTIENFEKQITHKQDFPASNRHTLLQALSKQYVHIQRKPQLALDLLQQNNTFTLTTGHQLNIFTGPLYFHFKIITVINAAKQLRLKYPHYNFIPVYWMASEDHDFEEISSFNLFWKKYKWQSEQQGAVGRFSPTSLTEVIAQTPEMDSLFREAYGENKTLAEATRHIVNELYGHEGLLVIDGDDKELKSLFRPIIKKEILQQPTVQQITKTNAELEKLGYVAQVFPRDINLFYLDDNLRERIVKEGNIYKVLNTGLSFSEDEILDMIENTPEKFSPNVTLRPVYQEVILPNLSYTGGPGEFAYWLQLKGVFEQFGVPFPILLPRNFGLIISKSIQNKIEKLGLKVEDLFTSIEEVKTNWLAQNVSEPIDLKAQIAQIDAIFEVITEKAIDFDKTLKEFVAAIKQKTIASVGQIEGRIQKSQHQRFNTEISQLTDLHNKLFPNGGLQERTDNFLNFYLNDKDFLIRLLDYFDPFDLRFNVLFYETTS